MTDGFETLALTNYGHFTTMRVEDSRVRGLTLHLDRLERDCTTLFGVPLDPDEVRAEIRKALTGPELVMVRVTVWDPAFSPAHPTAPAAPRIMVTTRAADEEQPALRVRSTRYVRDLPTVKHTGLLGPLYERRRAQRDGYDDALFIDADDLISEGVTWNVGFIDGDSVIWPRADVLPGVTAALLTAAHRGPVRTEGVRLDRLAGMTAAFATNAGGGVRGIAAIDGFDWPAAHPALRRLRAEYADIRPETL